MAANQKYFNRFLTPIPDSFDPRALYLGHMKYIPVFDLFIDGHYWRVRMDDPLISLSLSYENPKMGGRDAPFFKGYRMAADIPIINRRQRTIDCITVLFSNWSVKFGRIPGPHNDIHLDSYIEWLPKRWANNWLALPQNANLDFALAPIPDKTADNIDFATKHVSKSKINRNSVENSLSFSRYTISLIKNV